MQSYRYEGPRSEAILVRNLERDTKTIDLPEVGEDGQVKRGPGGKRVMRRIVLGSSLDADETADAARIGPEVPIAKPDWERIKALVAVKGWLKRRNIEAVNPLE